MAVVNIGPQYVTIFGGLGQGTFTERNRLVAGAYPESVVTGDFNNDGRPDLAVGDSHLVSDGVTILLGNAAFGFTEPPGSPIVMKTQGRRSLVVGDFNRDGKADLAAANAAINGVSILLGNGSGRFTFTPESPYVRDWVPSAIAKGDVNRDGADDLVVA